ncbi:DUF2088 domain-containing protein [Candidatus Thorarchaeota archaeon]|nr:MAG: DUF2088 domain-containing protein [Candidatus Thorarchaeota archaeon]
MRFDLQYGAGILPLEVSGRLQVDNILPTLTEEKIGIERNIVESLQEPIDSDSFSHIVTHANSAAVAINGDQDIEVNSILLNCVLDHIQSSLSSQIDISVIFPIGNLKSESVNEIKKRLGIHERDDYRLIPHDSQLTDGLNYVGETPTHCTPLYVNKVFMDAEIRIGIGTIRPDVFVGVTGGRMSVLPYSSGIKSIVRNSKLQATCSVGPFIIDNPVGIDLDEASRLACLDFIINGIPDCAGKLNGIVAGNPYTALEKGLPLARSVSKAFFHHKADIAIVSAGGASYDKTLYNAADALYAGKAVTEHGGVIVLVAECIDGPGPDGFVRGVSECSSSKEVAILSETGFEVGMEKSRFFWDILDSRKVIVCSRIRESLIAERFHCSGVKDPQEGYELAKSYIVSSPRIAVLPYGSRTLPIMQNT